MTTYKNSKGVIKFDINIYTNPFKKRKISSKMMEAMSSQYPPPKNVCKQILYDDIIKKYPDFNKELLKTIVEDEFKKFGGYEMLGSLSGWVVFSRKQLTNNISTIVDSYNKEVYKTFTLAI